MAIITKEVNGHKYLVEVISYRENGKVKTKWKSLGRVDENGDVIASKKNRRKAMTDAPKVLNKIKRKLLPICSKKIIHCLLSKKSVGFQKM